MSGAVASAANDFGGEFATAYQPTRAKAGEEYVGKIVGGADWSDFFLRPNNLDHDLLDQLWTGLDEFYSQNTVPSLKQVGAYQKGMPCAVRNANENKWQRARLEDATYNMVRFIDSGSVQLCDEDDIRVLLSMYAELAPPAGIRCSFLAAAKMPQFTIGRANVKVTLISNKEPFSVVIGFGNSHLDDGSIAAPQVSTSMPSTAGTMEDDTTSPAENFIPAAAAAATASASASVLPTPKPPTSRDNTNERGRPATTEGLSMMPQPAARANFDDDDKELGAKAAMNNRLATPSGRRAPAPEAQYSRYSIVNARGTFSDLFATCGGIVRQNYLMQRSEINTDQTGFCGGPLLVDDLRRLFRVNERVIYTAKFTNAFMTEEMEWNLMVAEDNDPDYKKKKGRETDPEPGLWLVTNFSPRMENLGVLVTHAVVTYVSDTVCSLYVRGSELNICAPKDTFPDKIARSSRPLRDVVDIGRTVIVRAQLSPLETGVMRVRTEWVAEAVEFVGQMFEERGTVYLVRETYSVIITEGNVGFGYVFVPNRVVQPAGVPLHEWYGTKVYFRSCVDVPDEDSSENIRFGNRMKAVYAQLAPEETKGSYRYPGIYRPVSVSGDIDDFLLNFDYDNKGKAKKLTEEDSPIPELTVEALREIRMWGVDAIGIDNTPTNPTDDAIIPVTVPDEIVWDSPEQIQEMIRQAYLEMESRDPTNTMQPAAAVADVAPSTIAAPQTTATTTTAAVQSNEIVEPLVSIEPDQSTAAVAPTVVAQIAKRAEPVDAGQHAAAAAAYSMIADDDLLMSTVEITMEEESVDNPLDAVIPMLPDLPALPPTPVESEEPESSLDTAAAVAVFPRSLSVACQTGGEYDGEEMDPAEKQRLFDIAVDSLRGKSEEELAWLMEIGAKLTGKGRSKFFKVVAAATVMNLKDSKKE